MQPFVLGEPILLQQPSIKELAVARRLAYKEWPILGESSVLAARAALAAAKQGQYFRVHARMILRLVSGSLEHRHLWWVARLFAERPRRRNFET